MKVNAMKQVSIVSIVSIFLLLSVSLQAQEWINPSQKKVWTVFYQGMNGSQTQGAKYTGLRGFISPTTGEHVICTKAIDVIKDIWVNPEIDEVIPAPMKRNWMALMLQPKALIYNVWQRSHELISGLSNKGYCTDVKNISSQALASTIASHSLVVSKINLGQEGDLANHRIRFDSLRQEHSDDDVILMGVSRGAATTFQSASLLNRQNVDLLKNVRLIILEGCFDSVGHTAQERHPWLLKYNCVFDSFLASLEHVTSFKRDGAAPIKVVADFPQHIPVVFITSLKDYAVPAVCTKDLVKSLIQHGHQDVYLLELKNSSHPRYMMDDANDALNYLHFMHALYKKYNLPYIPDYADKGSELVALAKNAAELLDQQQQ